MNNKHYKCCICGAEYAGFGNNPAGTLDENYNIIRWKKYARCCDACDKNVVEPGRLYIIAHRN